LFRPSRRSFPCLPALCPPSAKQEIVDLREPAHVVVNEISDEVWVDQVTVSTFDFPVDSTTSFWIGTEESDVHKAELFSHDDVPGGLDPRRAVYRGHSAAVTRVAFHPGKVERGFGELFLTSSMDQTVKFWRRIGGGEQADGSRLGEKGRGEMTDEKEKEGIGSPRAHEERGADSGIAGGAEEPTEISPLWSFREAKEAIYDVQWHPVHPAVFATVDGSNTFDLWDLNVNVKVRFLCYLLIFALSSFADANFLLSLHFLLPPFPTALFCPSSLSAFLETLVQSSSQPLSSSQSPTLSTQAPSSPQSSPYLNKLAWDKHEGSQVALGSSDGTVLIYDISEAAVPRDSEWTEMRKTLDGLLGVGGS
jgi:WD40 repeat protein